MAKSTYLFLRKRIYEHLSAYWRYWSAGVIGAATAMILTWISEFFGSSYQIAVTIGFFGQWFVNANLLKLWALPTRQYGFWQMISFGVLLLANLSVRIGCVGLMKFYFSLPTIVALIPVLPVTGIASWYITTRYILKEK